MFPAENERAVLWRSHRGGVPHGRVAAVQEERPRVDLRGAGLGGDDDEDDEAAAKKEEERLEKYAEWLEKGGDAVEAAA